jgi:hypothetical protein
MKRLQSRNKMLLQKSRTPYALTERPECEVC